MKKLTFIFAALAICFGISSNAFAQRLSKGDTAVISTIQNKDAELVDLNIQSDLLGSYKQGVDSVQSIIQGIGDWELDLINFGSLRRVYVNFSNPVPGTVPNNLTPPASGIYPARFLAQCSARKLNLNTFTVGTPKDCPLIVGIDVGTVRYQIRFNKIITGANDVPWTCLTALNGKCTSWRSQTTGMNGNGKAIANLQEIRWVGSKSTTVDYGKYYLSFDISLNKQ